MTTPAEEQMREQQFKTMVALEEAAKTVTAFLSLQMPRADGGVIKLQGPVEITGDATIKGDLSVEGTQTVATSEVEETEKSEPSDELSNISDLVVKHHKALAILSTYGVFKDAGVFGSQPERAIADLLGVKACGNCVGSGWLAKDEQCPICRRSGFIKS